MLVGRERGVLTDRTKCAAPDAFRGKLCPSPRASEFSPFLQPVRSDPLLRHPAQVTAEFLDFTRSRGNDLSAPTPWFPGLKPGDRWCLCASRCVAPELENGKASRGRLVAGNLQMPLITTITPLSGCGPYPHRWAEAKKVGGPACVERRNIAAVGRGASLAVVAHIQRLPCMPAHIPTHSHEAACHPLRVRLSCLECFCTYSCSLDARPLLHRLGWGCASRGARCHPCARSGLRHP